MSIEGGSCGVTALPRRRTVEPSRRQSVHLGKDVPMWLERACDTKTMAGREHRSSRDRTLSWPRDGLLRPSATCPGRWTQVTCGDYNLVMKNVGIADLKARMSEYLREVRKGRVLTVLDRHTPVARIVPYGAEPLEVRRATRRARDLVLPPRPARPTDSLRLLLEDRGRR